MIIIHVPYNISLSFLKTYVQLDFEEDGAMNFVRTLWRQRIFWQAVEISPLCIVRLLPLCNIFSLKIDWKSLRYYIRNTNNSVAMYSTLSTVYLWDQKNLMLYLSSKKKLFLQLFNIVQSVKEKKKKKSMAASPSTAHTFKKSVHLQCFGKNTDSDIKGV